MKGTTSGRVALQPDICLADKIRLVLFHDPCLEVEKSTHTHSVRGPSKFPGLGLLNKKHRRCDSACPHQPDTFPSDHLILRKSEHPRMPECIEIKRSDSGCERRGIAPYSYGIARESHPASFEMNKIIIYRYYEVCQELFCFFLKLR